MKNFIFVKMILLLVLSTSAYAGGDLCYGSYKSSVTNSAGITADRVRDPEALNDLRERLIEDGKIKIPGKNFEPNLSKFPKLLESKLKNPSKLSFEELKEIREDLIAYFKSFGPGKRVVIFTGATNLDPDFKPASLSNLKRPIKKQTSGVVTVMQVMEKDIKRLTGVDVRFVTPEEFGIHYQLKYQDIITVLARSKEFKKIISEKDNLAVHIMVEDQLGLAAKSFLEKRGIPYTTAYHTDFAQYAIGFSQYYLPKMVHNLLLGGPKRQAFVEKNLYKVLKSFHGNSSGIMVPTKTMADKLVSEGFPKDAIRYWSHGVDIELFRPELRDITLYEKELGFSLNGRPVALFVGRVSEEKNIRDFLDAKLESHEIMPDGTVQIKEAIKVIIGSGPELEQLKVEYPNAHFLGRKGHDTELPAYMASADGFVFPSTTETFGLVGPEAMAGGTPSLTYHVQGMKDWNTDKRAGVMVEYTKERAQNIRNLEDGWKTLRTLNREDVRAYAETIPWERSILEFLYFLKVLNPDQRENITK